jgi:uncharacterized protein (TIGR02246 family)
MQAPEHLLETYRRSVYEKDTAAFLSIFAGDVRVFDMWGRWQHRGLPEWRAMAEEWFGSLAAERVKVEFDEVESQAGPDFLAVSAFVTYTAVSAAGVDLRSLQNRLTWIARREDDGWKIVHEHTSGPVDHATLKVLLNRESSQR